MYYIEQVNGHLVGEANMLRKAVSAGQMETARRIYTRCTGDDDPSESMTWWTYNAPHLVRCASGLTDGDWATFNGTQEQQCEQAARLAKLRKGGTWVVCYEY
jgi:hypothetical protein